MSDTATRQALLNEVATNSIPDHAITSQNSHEDSTARSKRRIMSRLDVFLVHEPGKTVTVPCKESDTIEVVLKWIRNKLGINLDDLYRDDLYVNGRLIQSKDKTIGDSRIFGHVLTYHRLIKNPSVIYIVLPSGKVLEVACRLDMKAVYFRYAIEEKIFSRPDRTRLIYNGKRFEGEITLAEFGIQYGSTVYLLFMQGGEQTAENMITFQSILDAPGARPGELTPTLGTFYTKGKYIESHCPCSPGKVHIYPGSDRCELIHFSPYCGECHQNDRATVVGVGFVECQYRFIGIRKTGERVSSGWKKTEGNRYARLDPGEIWTGWRRLIFECAKMGEVNDCSICLSGLYGAFEECGECDCCFHASCLTKYITGFCPGCDLNRHLVGGSS